MNKVTICLLPFLTLLLSQCFPISEEARQSDYLNSYSNGYQTELHLDGSFRKAGYWDGDGIKGKAAIRISLSEQLAYFYKNSELVGISPISSGMGGYESPTGNFKVSQKNKDHTSSLYGIIVNKSTDEVINPDADSRVDKPGPGEVFKGAPMKYFMRIHGAVGMHTGYTPGYPASHGCIRLPEHMAKVFFENASLGTPVTVVH